MKNNKKIILGLVGDLAAGKGTVCAYLKDTFDAQIYRFSNILRDILKRLYVPADRTTLQTLSTLLRQQFGQDILSKVIAEDAHNETNQLVAIDGIRRPSDILYLKDLPGFHLVYVTADQQLRFERLVKRNENQGDDQKTLAEFIKDENAEADVLIKELGKKAEITIINNGTLEELHKQLDLLLEKYIK